MRNKTNTVGQVQSTPRKSKALKLALCMGLVMGGAFLLTPAQEAQAGGCYSGFGYGGYGGFYNAYPSYRSNYYYGRPSFGFSIYGGRGYYGGSRYYNGYRGGNWGYRGYGNRGHWNNGYRGFRGRR